MLCPAARSIAPAYCASNRRQRVRRAPGLLPDVVVPGVAALQVANARVFRDVVAEVPAVRLLLEALVAQPLLVAGNLVAADERRSRWSQPTSASHI